MSFLTGLALRRQSVTVLLIIMVLVGGILTYKNLSVELFPEIEFPLITVSTFYPSANPEVVVRDVTDPIENAILGVDGVDGIQSISSENRSVVLVNFVFGIDMDEAAIRKELDACLTEAAERADGIIEARRDLADPFPRWMAEG